MMTIGEFAQATGLTAKALRFYDEVGLLPPADVDPATGYRRYRAAQVRTAVAVRLLRATGLPVSEVREAITAPDRLNDLRRVHADRIAASRARQDRAVALADRLLPAYDEPAEVRTRQAPGQHWVGAFMTADTTDPADGTPDGTEDYNARFALLAHRLAEVGDPPSGPWWTTILPDADRVALLLCWPVREPLPDGFAVEGLTLRTGYLPPRTEIYVRSPLPDDGTGANDGTGEEAGLPTPAFVAFLEYCEEHELGPAEIRQVGVLDDAGRPTAVDLSATVAEANGAASR